MEVIFVKELATSRQELILFAEAVKEYKHKEDAVTKCGLFIKIAAGARQYWLQHIASHIGPNRIIFAHIMNTKTSYYTDGSQPLIKRKFIVVFLDFHQSTQTAIKGVVEVGERNISHNNNTFYCSTISYEEAKYYYMVRLKDCINYSSQPAETDTYPDIITTALGNYIAKNGLDLILGELPPLVYH